VASVRARVVKTDQSELFQNIALRKWMLLTRLDRVRFIVNNAHIWCFISIVRARVLNTDQSELFHMIIQTK